jgi:type III secretion system YopN/LcrE/InvE/MxiC family regulator
MDVRGASQVTGNRPAPAGREDEGDPEIEGSHNGELVVLEKDAIALSDELVVEFGRETVGEEMENELGREERRVEKAEEVVEAVVLAESVEDNPLDLPDVLALKDQIEALAREMQAKEMTDTAEILQHLRDNLGEGGGQGGPNHDATQQYGALALMEKFFADIGDPVMAAAMSAAGDRLLAERGSEINKGMIVSEAAALYASQQFGSVSDLRSLYIEQVFEKKGIPASFERILEKYGEPGFSEAVAFLLRAAGDDLATMTSNNDRAQQKEILDNLYQLEVLNTVRERTDGALAQIGKYYSIGPDATAQKVMRETFGMLENPVRMAETTVTKLARETVPDSVEGRIAFLREYRSLANLIPIKVFDEADRGAGGGLRMRERLTETIVQAQDKADAEEQEKLASQ